MEKLLILIFCKFIIIRVVLFLTEQIKLDRSILKTYKTITKNSLNIEIVNQTKLFSMFNQNSFSIDSSHNPNNSFNFNSPAQKRLSSTFVLIFLQTNPTLFATMKTNTISASTSPIIISEMWMQQIQSRIIIANWKFSLAFLNSMRSRRTNRRCNNKGLLMIFCKKSQRSPVV